MAQLPEAIAGPLRIGAEAATRKVLFAEPLLFAAHYATIADLIPWTEKIDALLTQVRTRYDAHDAVLELIDTLRGQVPMALSADLARRMAEGLELHTVLRSNPALYRLACAELLDHPARQPAELGAPARR